MGLKKLFSLAILFVLVSTLGFSQAAQRIVPAIQNPVGGGNFAKLGPNASVFVCTYNAQLTCNSGNYTNIYKDVTLLSPITQPVVADLNGVYQYFINSGTNVVEKVCFTASQCQSYPIYFNAGGGGGGNCPPSGGVSGYFLLDNTSSGCADSLADYNVTTPYTFTFPDSFRVNANTNSDYSDNGEIQLLSTSNNSNISIIDLYSSTSAPAVVAINNSDTEQGGNNEGDTNATNIDQYNATIYIEAYATSGEAGGPWYGMGNVIIGAVSNSVDDGYIDIAASGGVSITGYSAANPISIDQSWTAPINIAADNINLYEKNGVYFGGASGIPGAIQLNAGATPPTPPTNTFQMSAPPSVTAYGVVVPSAQGTGALTNDGSGHLSWSAAGGTGTVTSVSVVTANGVSGSVATSTTTPAITLALGAITPTSTNGVSAATMAYMDATSSVQTQINAKAPLASPTFTGTVTIPTGAALGTPASLVLTNATGLPYAALSSLSANQVLGALTATTPSGLSLPSCSGASNALTWTSGTGFGCNTINGPSARKSTFTCTAGGTIAVANTNEAATSDVIISLNTVGGTISTAPVMKAVTAGTGFTVLCGSLDTSVYNYDILN